MLVGILALSLAFIGCGDGGVGVGEPAPFYLQGNWAPANLDPESENAILVITPLTATYGTAPYRINVTITSQASALPAVTGTIEFWEYATGEVVGTITITSDNLGGGAPGVEFEITASDIVTPFFAPGKGETYTKQ